MSTVGGYLEYRGGCSVPWGDIIPWGDIMMKFEWGDMHVGGYHEYRGGCSILWGTQITIDFSPHGTEHPPRYS